jgi:hypothetical protein
MKMPLEGISKPLGHVRAGFPNSELTAEYYRSTICQVGGNFESRKSEGALLLTVLVDFDGL